MKLSISKLLIALNCLVIIFWGSIINRMDYTTIIYMGILIIINAIYSLKYKYARNIYWIEIGYLFLILLWFINGIPIYSSICYFIILVEEVHFFLNMFRARRNNDDFAIKIVVWLMGLMAFYGIYEGVTQNNPLFLRFFSENALTDYKNSFLYTYNTVGSMEESLIFAMLLSMSSIFILMMGNKRNKYLLYIVFGIAMFFTNKRSALLMWILVYVIYEVLDAWFISNKRTYAVRLFKIMFGIAIGIFILSIVKIKGNTILSLVTGKFTGLFSEDSRSYMQRYGALIIALELILQKNSIFGFLFGNGLSSLVGNFVTNRRTITDLNFYVIDNQYITSWYDSGFVFLILCVFICVHFIIELTKIIGDKHIEISLRKKSLVLLIGMILVMFYSFIIDVLTWYQPIFIISFIIALSNWNIKEAKKECEYTR